MINSDGVLSGTVCGKDTALQTKDRSFHGPSSWEACRYVLIQLLQVHRSFALLITYRTRTVVSRRDAGMHPPPLPSSSMACSSRGTSRDAPSRALMASMCCLSCSQGRQQDKHKQQHCAFALTVKPQALDANVLQLGVEVMANTVCTVCKPCDLP